MQRHDVWRHSYLSVEKMRVPQGHRGILSPRVQVNAGTVEFMVEPNGNYYFLEVNPRIQVPLRPLLPPGLCCPNVRAAL